jgi:hypothetical protein
MELKTWYHFTNCPHLWPSIEDNVKTRQLPIEDNHMHLSPLRLSLRLAAAVILLALPVVAQTAMLEGSAPDPAVPANTVQLQAQKAQFDSRPLYQSGNVTKSQIYNNVDGAGAYQTGVANGITPGVVNAVPGFAVSGLRAGAATSSVRALNSLRAGTSNGVTAVPNRSRPLTAVGAHPTPVRTVYVKDNRTFWQKHPMVKGATIGAGVGAGAGALTGLVTRQGVIRGAVIGAGAGAGVGALRQSKIMKRHPIARDVATGAVAGLGLGWAGSRWPRTVAATTGVGAAIGLGAGLLTHLR